MNIVDKYARQGIDLFVMCCIGCIDNKLNNIRETSAVLPTTS